MSSEFGVRSLEQAGRKWRDCSCLLLMACCFLFPAPAPAQKVEEKVMAKVWEKDPFAPPSIHTAVEVEGREAAPDLSLSTILFSDERSTAVINGKIFRIGDDISGQKILDIKRTYVIVGSEKKSYRLELRK